MTRRELWASVNGNYAVGVQVVERELERSTADPGGEAAPPQLLSDLPADLQAA